MVEEPNILFIVLSSTAYVLILALLVYFLIKKLIIEPFPGLVLNRKSTAELIDQLGEREDRATAMNILVKRGSGVITPLIEALEQKPFPVRIGAVETLGVLGDRSAVEPLLRALLETQEKTLQRPIILTLGQLADSRAAEPLLDIFEDIESELQLETGLALTQIMANTRERNPLLRALDTKKTPFLENAIISAGKTGDPRFIAPLTHILEQDDRRYIREKAVDVLGSFGAEAITPIATALKDSYWQVRAHAVTVLAKMDDKRALDMVIELFHVEKRVSLRQHIATMLGETGDTRVIPTLVKAFDDEEPEVRQTAEHALQSMGVMAIETLRNMLAEPDCHHTALITRLIEQMYRHVEQVIFGKPSSDQFNPRTTLINPNVFELSSPLSHLKQIAISAKTYHSQQVEQFFSYAVEYIGREHLITQVDVQVYGDPNDVEQALLNTINQLCRSLKFFGGEASLPGGE